MGCGNSKDKEELSSEEKQQQERAEKAESDNQILCDELDALVAKDKKQKGDAETAKTNAASATSGSSAEKCRSGDGDDTSGDGGAKGGTFQAVISRKMVEPLCAIQGVSLTQVQGNGSSYVDTQDNVVMISCPTEKVSDVFAVITTHASLVKEPKPVPVAPPVVDKEDAKAKAIEDKKKKKADGDGGDGIKEEKPEEPEADAKKVPSADKLEVKTDINFMAKVWDGVLPLNFEWRFEASPYNEYDDPSGSNWRPGTHVRKAPYVKPKEVVLQIRQGMTGEWTDHQCVMGETSATYTYELCPEEKGAKASAYRGFQSRWIVDGEMYLSPLQLAPTLQSKLMTYPIVRTAIKALPKDKQKLEYIENENLRKACMMIENIIPMNTWDAAYGVTLMPGAYLDDELTLTLPQKIEMIAKAKMDDPAVQSELRKTILKSPIMIANAGAGTVGIKLNIIVNNMSFFLPKMADPDFELLEDLEANNIGEDWETLRREMQIDINELYPQYLQGVRVTFPPAHILRNAMISKRPVVQEPTTFPVEFSWLNKCDDIKKIDENIFTKSKVQLVVWPAKGDAETDKTVHTVEPEAKEEEFGFVSKEKKMTYRQYTVKVALTHQTYKYYWLLNDQPHFNNGAAYGDEFKAPACYHTFALDGHIQFGIGVEM